MRPLGSKSAYHFVIRNRADSWEDLLEVGDRWQRQLAGAYWAGPESQWVNHHGIGIWVENNQSGEGPDEEQLQKLIWLVQRLQSEFQIPADRVILQVDGASATRTTRWFPAAWFRQQLLAFEMP